MTKDQHEVAQVFGTWAGSEIAADVEQQMSLLAPGFTFWEYSRPAPVDRAAYRQLTVDTFKKGKILTCTIEPTLIQIVGQTAAVHGTYAETVRDTGGTVIAMAGPWTASLVRENGKWLVLALAYVNAPADDPKTAEKELTQLEHDWCRAYLNRDTKTLGRIEAADWVCTSGKGEVFSRAEDIADLESGAYAATEFKIENVKVRLHGDTAVVTGVQTEKSTYKGEDVSGVFAITDTWQKQPDGNWQCIASQLTNLGKK